MLIPIFVARVYHLLQRVHECLVETLIEAVRLWVVCTGDAVLHICQPEEMSVELVHELPPLIRLNISGSSMLAESLEQKVGNTLSVFRPQRCSLRPLCEVVREGDDKLIACFCLRKTSHQVNANSVPCLGYRNGMKLGSGFLQLWVCPLTLVTMLTELPDICMKPLPIKLICNLQTVYKLQVKTSTAVYSITSRSLLCNVKCYKQTFL